MVSKFSDLFWHDSPAPVPVAWQVQGPFSRELKWYYSKRAGTTAIIHGSTDRHEAITTQRHGDEVSMFYGPMTDELIDQNADHLLHATLSMGTNVRIVPLTNMVQFFEESFRGKFTLCVDESSKYDFGTIPKILLRRGIVSPDRIIGIADDSVGVVSKTDAGVGMFLLFENVRSAYVRR